MNKFLINCVNQVNFAKDSISEYKLLIGLEKQRIDSLLNTIAKKVNIKEDCIPLLPEHVKKGEIIIMIGDHNEIFAMEIIEPINVNSENKAFFAQDGCRYGLKDCFYMKK